MTFPCPYCKKPLRLEDADVLSQAAAIHNSRRITHGAGSGRPRGYRKCAKCGKFHLPNQCSKEAK